MYDIFYGPIVPEINYSILFYSILFYSILFYSILFYKLQHNSAVAMFLLQATLLIQYVVRCCRNIAPPVGRS